PLRWNPAVTLYPHTERFEKLVAGDDDAVPLDEAALLIAAHAYPELDVAAELGRLDALADRCPGDELDVLLEYLFGECAFTGGRRLSEADRRTLLAANGGVELDPSYLAPVGPRAILARMLANLKQVYLQTSDARSLEWVVALRTVIPGVDPAELAQLSRIRVN